MSSDRDALVELLARYASIPDAGDWDQLPASVFTDPVRFDFESITGVPPAELPLATLLAGFRAGLAPFATTHHAITNHRVTVEGDQADVRAHVRAEHWLRPELADDGPNCWLLVGFYDHHAVRTTGGWRLDRIALTVTHQDNAHLRTARRGRE
jgi:3-phenylpropionate/cinnamic acid dioxygenase small subunit